jgi:hypothetical protein
MGAAAAEPNVDTLALHAVGACPVTPSIPKDPVRCCLHPTQPIIGAVAAHFRKAAGRKWGVASSALVAPRVSPRRSARMDQTKGAQIDLQPWAGGLRCRP